LHAFVAAMPLNQSNKFKGGDFSKMCTCPLTIGFKKPLVRTNAPFVRTLMNTDASTSIST